MEKCYKLVLAFVLFIVVAHANFDVDTPLVHASSLKKLSMNDFPACFPNSQCCYDGSKTCPEDQECLICTKSIPASCFCSPKRKEMRKSLPAAAMEFVHASNMGDDVKCQEWSQCCPGSKPCPKGKECQICYKIYPPACICTDVPPETIATVV